MNPNDLKDFPENSVISKNDSSRVEPRILVVDDDEAALGYLTELLSLNGFNPVTSTSGEEALAKFSESKPDIVLTDIQMPGIDGMKLLKTVRELDDITPVIMITGHGEVDNAIKALRLGAYDFLLKPINTEILISTLEKANEHCRLKRLEDEYTHRLEAQVASRTRELARTNDFLRGILDSSTGVSIVVSDLEENVIFWNSGAENILGYHSGEMIGQSILKLYPKGVQLSDIRKKFMDKMQDGSGSLQELVTQVSKEGNEVILSMAISPMHDTKGKLQGILALGQDVTERVHLHEQLVESYQRIRNIQGASIFALAKLAEARDGETGSHLKRLQAYCECLCRRLSMKTKYSGQLYEDYILDLVQCSVLHDIGKLVIPDSILFHPGRFTENDFEIMKQHALFGGKALEEAAIEAGEGQSYLTVGSEVCYYHHEKWDGSGYPFGLKGNHIPLSARIVAVCDVYDALTTERRYKPAYTHEEASSFVEKESGRHFDPDIIQTFTEIKAEFAKIAKKVL
ncbi:MAG: response regulator [Desulfomonilaceae bacterium]